MSNTFVGATLRFYFGSYDITRYTENSADAKKGDFWTFMGTVGGTAFLFWLIYHTIMLLVSSLFFKETSHSYQDL